MRRKMGLVIFSTLLVNFLCIYLLFVGSHTYTVNLNGEQKQYLSFNTEFNDDGFTIYNNKRIIDKKEAEYSITSNVDTKALGEYKIEYIVKYQGKEYKLERIVEVVDNTPPTIDTNTDTIEKSYCEDKAINNLEFTATDDYDGDITSKVVKEEKEDKIILTVKDSHNNEITKELSLVYRDQPSNKVVLNGKSSVTISVGGSYTEEGAYYSDGCGNKINEEIEIEGSVDTSKEGKYTITYKSKTENDKKATRTVEVKNMPSSYSAPVTGNSVIYLTFDDGPCYYTKQILDTLDKYNIKATFFVTNQISGYQNMIAEEARRGHTIGVHSKTHQWNIYNSLDSYWNDFNQMNDIIEQQTGKRTSILRFPGGTSNHMAKIPMSTIASSVTSKGLRYYDWNVCVEDAGSCVKSSNKEQCVYNYFVGGLKPGRDNVVLLHDLKSYTANSLERMIQYGLSKGYTFKAIDENTAQVHFRPWK